MKIKDILESGRPTLSFEVFPPKAGSDIAPILEAVRDISEIRPDFMSVTYGAGGGTSDATAGIASFLQNKCHTTALAHLSCVSASKNKISSVANDLKRFGVENILALRGDIPDGVTFPDAQSPYRFAYQLIADIREMHGDDFCIGAACYPEGHVECESKEQDIIYLKNKVDAGCDFLTTQMFFDNAVLYSFLYRILKKGINVPVIAGIMPVTNGKQIERICRLSGTSLPSRFRMIVDKFGGDPASMKQAGIAYATEQIIDLIANGVRGIHVYTMNKPDIAKSIESNLKHIMGRV